MHKQINLVSTRKVYTRGVPMEGAPPVANQIDLFMHFPGVSRNGQVARPVEMDKLSFIHHSLIAKGLDYTKYRI
jgi:hypothetical protein